MLDGEAPEAVLDAYKKIKYHAFEFPSAYGQNCVVIVSEADEMTYATFTRYWADLMAIKIFPSVPFEVFTMKEA